MAIQFSHRALNRRLSQQPKLLQMIVASCAWLAVVILHVFNHTFHPKNYVPVHVAATLMSLGGATLAAMATLRIGQIGATFRISGRVAAGVLIPTLMVSVGLYDISNDVRHALFTRAFDSRGVLYAIRRIPGLRPRAWVRTQETDWKLAPASAQATIERVVLITIDSLRADHLPTYGYPRMTAPAITAFGNEAVVFDWAWSAAGRTKASLLAIVGAAKEAGLIH
ncbi:MAG TPA: hypothetical protein VGG33_00115, partial [Polyangia bacterium]